MRHLLKVFLFLVGTLYVLRWGYCAGFAGCVKILEKKERQPDYAWRKAFSSTPEVRPTEIFGSYEEARLAMAAL